MAKLKSKVGNTTYSWTSDDVRDSQINAINGKIGKYITGDYLVPQLAGVNIDNLFESGIYYITHRCTGMPSNGPGYMICSVYSTSSNDHYAKQIFQPYNSNVTYSRTIGGGTTWGSWQILEPVDSNLTRPTSRINTYGLNPGDEVTIDLPPAGSMLMLVESYNNDAWGYAGILFQGTAGLIFNVDLKTSYVLTVTQTSQSQVTLKNISGGFGINIAVKFIYC